MVASFDSIRKRTSYSAAGFTLVELLIVISIIGVLVALTMPAINSARESGRRTTCQNNLHQLVLGCQAHESKWQYFPSGGWGKWWAGNPERGAGIKQPGGWHYSILPFIDQKDLYDWGSNKDKAKGAMRAQTPVSVFICPTRHKVQVFPITGASYKNIDSSMKSIARSDYAGNAGSNTPIVTDITTPDDGLGIYQPPNLPWASIPGTPNMTSPAAASTGTICRASPVSAAQIKDGLTYTYLLGERYMTIAAYGQGANENDAGWDSGYDYNTIRWTINKPYQDSNNQPAANYYASFGSAHPAGFHMAFCDGVVRKMTYDIDPAVHKALGHRNDGQPTQLQDIEGNR